MQVVVKDMKDHWAVRIKHSGFHNHAIPHAVHPSLEGRQEFLTMVRTAPEVHPKQLVNGTMTRKPVSTIHPLYANKDRVGYERSKILRGTSIASSFSAMAAFELEHNIVMIRSSSISNHNGHITIQTAFMKQQTATVQTCMQSDSVHGFIIDDHYSDVNLTFTSAFCPVIQRTVSLVVSIMLGKTQVHYQAHFMVLLQALPYKTW
ncbi:hypothetical protein EC968_005731 [Mortierella alpina]|nr:hypothetical protein EC968_005731 [Mortierella alpina]